MLRFLWIVALVVVAGAEEHDPLKLKVKHYFAALNNDINIALRNSFGVPTKASTDGSYTASSTTDPTSRCASTTSSTAYPVSQPSMGTTGDCGTEGSSAEPDLKGYPSRVGSIKGVAGVNFPNYLDIPLTSFSCSDKDYIPGFYADMETGCQVFHMCWPHRRESFLCPVGTTFNQALLACDYWYSTNCSLAPHYYKVNEFSTISDKSDSMRDVNMSSMIDVLLGTGHVEHPEKESKNTKRNSSMNPDSVFSFISNFLPVRAKVTVYPETESNRQKIVATASVGETTQRENYHGKHSHKPSKSSKKSFSASKKDEHGKSKNPSEYQYSTQSPETSSQKYAEVQETVKVILDEVFETVQNILREVRGIVAIQKARTPVHGKHFQITKLNPRFKTEPIMLPEDSKRPLSVSSTTEAMGGSSSTKSVVSDIPERSARPKTQARVQLSVSPMTKKALTASYLRFLKLRKA